MSIEAMKQALENELSASDFIDKAPQSWDKTERTEWARLQAMLHNIRVFKKAMRQAIAEAEKQDKFCDDNCVWTDHHKDCVRASVSWKDMAFARLGVVRDKMHPDDVATVQRFLDDDYTHPQPKRETPKAGDGHDLFYEAVRLLDNAIFAQSGDVVRHDSAAHKEALDFFNHVFTQLDLPPTQPKREWVGLTDDEIIKCTPTWGGTVEDVARAIEAKLKSKNGF